MKFIIILLIISAIIALSVSYWISSKEITSEDVPPNYSFDKKADKATENWKAKEKELEKQNEEFCKENPIKCDKG